MSIIYHIGRAETDHVTEGGVARDLAFSRALRDVSVRVRVGRNAFKDIYTLFKFLLSSPAGSQVVLHYPNVGIHISDRFIIGAYIRRVYIFLIERLSLNNELVVDIADMPCEQAIDLELPTPKHYQDIELRLFNAAKTLVPASASMQKLILDKYPRLALKTFIVCNNGGEKYAQSEPNPFSEYLDVDAIKFVYAGTLNKGRGIEELLDAFNGRDATLYLLGSGGEWIREQIMHATNVFYIGELSESDAFGFVSKCDVGLIPYDSERYYYNVAFPTKLSFYVTAGIPYLCTPVAEAVEIQKQSQCGWIYPINYWTKFIDGLDLEELNAKKKIVAEQGALFTWESTLEPLIEHLKQTNGEAR